MGYFRCYLKLSRNVCTISRRWNSTAKKIDKLLIANRGEIACRIIRSAKKLGVKTVAVYSDADKNAVHVHMADEAYHIGPPPAQSSYLKGTKLIEVAKKSDCQAIHPGYGFLSENAEFAEECQTHNIIFVGPPASAIRDMGIKSTSKAIMSRAGVPIIEGYHGEDQSDSKLEEEAARIGYPIMIKAVRGGGGKGMRIALTENEFNESLQSARTESQKSFSDSNVLLERFIAEPRHVEVQVFADLHGNVVHLFERDCSVQRRHQKVIEEAPAPDLSDSIRSKLGMTAVNAAKAVGYVGAGTVEFILDRHSHNFHFMEMNTRLQVEHPITEMITSADLVEWQIKIASGERLPLTQKDIKINGHAFEARIYAEDPANNFLPGAGPLVYIKTPLPADDVRVETGVRQGDEVSVHYDPMIAKLVVWGSNRGEALDKMKSKLSEYHIVGLETNVNFLMQLCSHKEFIKGNVYTNFIKDFHDSLFPDKVPNENQLIQASIALILKDELECAESISKNKDEFNPFFVESNFRVNYHKQMDVHFKTFNGIKLKLIEKNKYEVSLDDGKSWQTVTGEIIKDENLLKCNINDNISYTHVYLHDGTLSLFDQSGKSVFYPKPTVPAFEDLDSPGSTGNSATAPMPGILDKILVKTGDVVKKGDALAVLIAMKMEFIIRATMDAKISNIQYKIGDSVPKDAVVIEFEK